MNAFKKKLIVSGVAIAMAVGGAASFAKGGMDYDFEPNSNQSQRLEYIFNQLELTEAQQAEVNQVMAAFREQNREMMWDTMKAMRDQEDRPTKEEMQTIRDQHREASRATLRQQLGTVLSADQVDELVEYLDAHRSMGDRGDHHGNKGENRDSDNRGQTSKGK